MTTKADTAHNADHADDLPPIFRSWKAVYFSVLSFLAALILLFYLFMKLFS